MHRYNYQWCCFQNEMKRFLGYFDLLVSVDKNKWFFKWLTNALTEIKPLICTSNINTISILKEKCLVLPYGNWEYTVKAHIPISLHEPVIYCLLCTARPLIIESRRTNKQVSTGAHGALDDRCVVQTKIWKSGCVPVLSTKFPTDARYYLPSISSEFCSDIVYQLWDKNSNCGDSMLAKFDTRRSYGRHNRLQQLFADM